MKPDGSIDEQIARAKIPKDVPQEKVDLVINTCKAQGRAQFFFGHHYIKLSRIIFLNKIISKSK